MAFPRSVLVPGEDILVHTHPHWRALVRPGLVVVAGAGLAGISGGFAEAQFVDPDRSVAWLVVAAVYGLVTLRFAAWPLMRWARTDIVVTDDRVLYRPAGSRRRYRVDVPLARVSAVRYRHTLADRALGTGVLILERGYHPPVEIPDVPAVARVHAAVYDELGRGRMPMAERGGWG